MDQLLILLFASIIVPTALLFGQTLDQEAWEAFQTGQFTRVEELVQRSLQDTLNDSVKARIIFAYGCAEAMRGRRSSALISFREVLRLWSPFHPDPDTIPPPAWNIFEQAMGMFPSSGGFPSKAIAHSSEPALNSAPPSHKGEKKPLPQYLLQSLLLPSWGLMETEKREGLWWLVAQGVTLGVWVYYLRETHKARQDYLNATEQDIEAKYQTYNRLYRRAWVAGMSTIAIYLGAQVRLRSASP